MSTTPQSPTLARDARAQARADRVMRRLLCITTDTNTTRPADDADAHRAFRASLIVSGVRCLITYLLIPILVPLVSFAGLVAAPIGIMLCVIAVVNGIVSLRRFWKANHRARWMYTAFISIVFAVLILALITDLTRLLP